MSILTPTRRPHWLHLIWASADGRAWLPEAHQLRLCHRLQAVCRQRGLYLELIGAQADHVHLLLRLHRRGAEATLRGLLAHTCREFVDEVLPPALRRDLHFTDWRQPLCADQLGLIRRRILRQDFLHRRQSLADELAVLGLDAPNGACIVLGTVLGETSAQAQGI